MSVNENSFPRTLRKFAWVAAALGATGAYAESVDRRQVADPRGEVEIGNVAGSVRVLGWDRAEVEVKGELGDGVERLDFERNGDRIVVKVVLRRRTSSGGADLTVRVPHASRVLVNTVSADVTVSDVRGAQRLQSVSGGIEAQPATDLHAKTVSGTIEIEGSGESASRTRVETVSGTARLIGLAGELEFESVSGDARIEAADLTRGTLETTNGDLHLVAKLARDATVDVEAVNGDITIDLRDVANTAFVVETFNGEVDNCFGQKQRRAREYGPGTELRFVEGEGLARVRVETMNGDVRLCKK